MHIYDHLGGNPNWFYYWSNGMEGSSIVVSPLQTTTYTVVVYSDPTFSCYTTVSITVYVTTGISEYEAEKLVLYPNPTSGIVNVEFEMGNEQWKDAEIQIFDMYGKLLHTEPANDSTIQTDMSPFADGVYTFRIKTQDGVVTRKIVKQR